MAQLRLILGGHRSPPAPTGSRIRFGASPSMDLVLQEPVLPEEEQDGSPRHRIPRHVGTISVFERVVQVRHEERRTRAHGLWVVQAHVPGPSVNLDYGCSATLHGRGHLLIRDSPGAPRWDTFADIRIGFEVTGVELPGVLRAGADDLLAASGTATAPAVVLARRAGSFALRPSEIDYVAALALPWLTGRPELWLSDGDIRAMWSLGRNTVNKAMANVRARMVACDPPLWDPVNDERPGANVAAAAVLADLGVVTEADLEPLNVLAYLRGEGAARRSRPRRPASAEGVAPAS